MTLAFIRTLFVLLSMVIGYQIGSLYLIYNPIFGILGVCAGGGIALAVILTELSMARISLRGLSAAVFGLVLALIVSRFVHEAIDLIKMDVFLSSMIKLVVVLVLSYIGMVFAIRGREEFSLIIPYVKLKGEHVRDSVTLLDTSAIIDGRIVDLVGTHFIEGNFIVPKFVLKELQALADSADPLKRSRGRRGLDILSRIRSDAKLKLRIHEQDYPDVQGVDAKLVKMAKALDAQICTTDFNLNKVAELQDVAILNIHELTKALKPVVLPGEILHLTVTREGKEKNQGIAYLNDGTMVVVENGRALIGREASVVVASVLQTSAGRMIFSKLENGR